jgi:hypothetical protein
MRIQTFLIEAVIQLKESIIGPRDGERSGGPPKIGYLLV